MELSNSSSSRGIYIILGLIAVGIISFHLTVNLLIEPENSEKIVIFMSSGMPIVVFIASVIMVKKYKISGLVADAYIFLGLAYLCLGVGDIIWNILDYNGLETYPSIADIVFYLAYPMLIIFHLKNMKKFTPDIFTKRASKKQIISLVTITATLILIYTVLSLSTIDEINFDFWYGLIFVTTGSVIFSMTLHVSWIVRKGEIGKIWKLIMLGVFLYTFGDIWYYHSELLEEFTMFHPVNMMFYSSYFVIIYAFIQHKKEFV